MFMNKSVHNHVSTFNTILADVFINYIYNQYVSIDDKDPPWMMLLLYRDLSEHIYLTDNSTFILSINNHQEVQAFSFNKYKVK